ncbi:head GIN domain-containing protein [Winogradskyella sp. A3E31]|uniref:head GIN domain-containing protein n=1 Tax=Winogradskyella sp. A3E31 TaxID=3349637 RepID=UPI00398B82A6
MNTLAKLITSSILALLMLSCNFDFDIGTGVTGNGNVLTEDRILNDDFNAIEVSRGLDVYITQSGDYGLSVEADENLHDIILTEVENGTLKITTSDNIRKSKSQKVMVNAKNLEAIKATSGSDVYSEGLISASNLKLTASSGADLNVEVKADQLICSASSGSDIKVAGNTTNLEAKATSGSDINAKNLIAEYSDVEANSGADISVHSSKELTANANSGGDVRYYGNPEKVNKTDGVSGSVRKN